MILRAFKLRFRRRLRLQKRQVEELGQQAEQQLEQNFFKRLGRLAEVRRFVISWTLLLTLLGASLIAQTRALSDSYQTLGPVPGGQYTEGVLGSFTNANPVYASSPADLAVSKMLFASLFTYDERNQLVGDLAQDWAVDGRGTTYTVNLKPNLKWHDGKPLTAEDVVFTYQVIQNPDARSHLNASWQGVEVAAVSPTTITFKLPTTLASFPYSLTNGIIPKHVLQNEPMSGLRSSSFNTIQAVGAGPFTLSNIEVSGGSAEDREESIVLHPFEQYHRGKPKLDSFIIRSFRDQDRLLQSFRDHEITGMSGLTYVPEDLQVSSVRRYNLPFTAAVMAFMRTNSELLADVKVRQALVLATNQAAVLKALEYPALPVRGPLLQGQVGYNKSYDQPGYDLATAQAALDAAGWTVGKDGIRSKNDRQLTLVLHAQDNTEYARVARQLQTQWRAAGVDLRVVLDDTSDFQTTLTGRGYDVLLYGISIGKDPDVYVYWDSKQSDARTARLNFSEYKSGTADEALLAGRTRLDSALRAVKYQPFLQAWKDDAPAVGLYQPRYLYITRGEVYGLSEHRINSDVERFTNVHNWMIRERGVSQTDRQ
jgi:peptide/nickel transport system substrate-binding protein